MAKGTRNKGGGSANKEVNKENHKNVADNRQQNHSTDHPGNVKGGKQHRNKQKIVVSRNLFKRKKVFRLFLVLKCCTDMITIIFSTINRKTKIQR